MKRFIPLLNIVLILSLLAACVTPAKVTEIVVHPTNTPMPEVIETVTIQVVKEAVKEIVVGGTPRVVEREVGVTVTPSSGAPGTIVKVMGSGFDTPNLLYVARFATLDWAVEVPLSWDEPGRLSLVVPLLPPASVSLTVVADDRESEAVDFAVLDLVDTGKPAGEVIFEFLDNLVKLLDVMYALDMSDLPEAADIRDAILLTKSDVAWLRAILDELKEEGNVEALTAFDAVLVASSLPEELEALLAEAELVNLGAQDGLKVASLNLVPRALSLKSFLKKAAPYLIITGLVICGIGIFGAAVYGGVIFATTSSLTITWIAYHSALITLVGKGIAGLGALMMAASEIVPPPDPKIRCITPKEGKAGTQIRIEGQGFNRGVIGNEVHFKFTDKNGQKTTMKLTYVERTGNSFIVLLVPDVSTKVNANQVQAKVWVKVGDKKSNEVNFIITDIHADKKLVIVDGNNQSGRVTTTLRCPLKVQATTRAGEKLDDHYIITFSVVQGPGRLSCDKTSCEVTTNNESIASTKLTLGTEAGIYKVSAEADGFANSVIFKVEAKADQPHEMVIVGDPKEREGEVESPLGESFKVLIKDQYGNPVPNVKVKFGMMEGDGLMEGQSRSTSMTTDDQGMAWSRLWLGTEMNKKHLVRASVAEKDEIYQHFSARATGPLVTIPSLRLADGTSLPLHSVQILRAEGTPIPPIKIELKNHTGQAEKVDIIVKAASADGTSKLDPVTTEGIDVAGEVGRITEFLLTVPLESLFDQKFPKGLWEITITVGRGKKVYREGTFVFEGR